MIGCFDLLIIPKRHSQIYAVLPKDMIHEVLTELMREQSSGEEVDVIDTLSPGVTYMFALALFHDGPVAGEGGCPPNEGETHTLVFASEGGGASSSWDLRYTQNINEGDQLI